MTNLYISKKIVYVCGADAWEKVRKLLPSKYPVACVGRNDYELPASSSGNSSTPDREVYFISADEGNTPISSTRVRNALKERDVETARSMLHPRVLEHLVSLNDFERFLP